MRKFKSALFAVVLLPSLLMPAQAAADTTIDSKALSAEKARAEKMLKTVPLTDVLGPLAPIALSPYFALTCLSGYSLFAGDGSSNMLIKGNPILGNGLVFAALLLLTLATSAPKFFKVTKPVAQVADQLETYSGLIVLGLVQYAAHYQIASPSGETAEVLYTAGVFSFTWSTLLVIASAINVFVINTIKFFFEFLIWLSPFPTVDAIFEMMNKAVTAFLIGLYAFSPVLATIVNLIIFAFCLLIFNWTWRRVVYYRNVLCWPLLAALFFRPPPTARSTHLPGSIRKITGRPKLVVRVFANRKWRNARKRASGYLVVGEDDRVRVVVPRFLRSKLVLDLPAPGGSYELRKGFISGILTIDDTAGQDAGEFSFSRRYFALLPEMAVILGTPPVEGAAGSSQSFKEARAEMAAAMQKAGAGGLKSELA